MSDDRWPVPVESLPAGFAWILWGTGLRCEACGAITDGVGYTLEELAEKHRHECAGTVDITDADE